MKIGEIAIKAIHVGSVAAKALAIGANKIWQAVYIRKVGTNEVYSEAVDIEGAPYEYEETDKEIEEYDNRQV